MKRQQKSLRAPVALPAAELTRVSRSGAGQALSSREDGITGTSKSKQDSRQSAES